MSFEEEFYKDKNLGERVEEGEGRRNTLLRLPDTAAPISEGHLEDDPKVRGVNSPSIPF